jgi:hypothetical protein
VFKLFCQIDLYSKIYIINLIKQYLYFTENVSKDNKTANKKYQSDDILICETNDVKLDDSNKEKELMFNLNIENRSIKTSDEESMIYIISLLYT